MYNARAQVAGSLDLPLEVLREAFTVHGNNDQKNYYWEAMERLSMEQRSMVLKFATGRSRLPLHITLNLGESH